MYISNSHSFVYLGVPKTASRTTGKWLRRYFGAMRNGTHHSVYFIPSSAHKWKEVVKYFVFATVRNPYTRVLSAWFSGSDSLSGEFKNKSHQELINIFENDVAQVDFNHIDNEGNIIVDDGSLRNKIGFPRSQLHYLSRAKENFDNIHLVRQENLAEELYALPFASKKPLDLVGKSAYGEWTDFYQNENVRDTVWECYKKDFELLNYPRSI